MKRKAFGIAFSVVLCLFAAPKAKAQPSCVAVRTTEIDATGIPSYAVTNHCTFAVEGVFATKLGGSYSFGPLGSGDTSVLQSTSTGPYRLYVCEFPKLSRIALNQGNWTIWKLPGYDSDFSLVSCQ
jgi:hypothetical protein